MLNQQIAQNIRFLCKRRGVSVSAMLKTLSINQSFVYEMEKKDKSPRIDTLVKIADFLGCTVNDLLI